MCVNAVLTAADKLKLGFLAVWNMNKGGMLDAAFAFDSFRVRVQNTLGNLKVKALTILQDLVNGAIDRINKLIGMANKIPGISFDLLGHVEFAAGAEIEEQMKQQERAAELARKQDVVTRSKAEWRSEYDRAARAADDARMQRQAGIEGAKADAAARAAGDDAAAGAYDSDIAGSTGQTAGNTAAMADTMDAMDEEIKYMRDAAEQEVINRFTLAELKIDLTNNNTLKTETDFDRMNDMLNDLTDEILSTAAEGGHL
jgi:chemotaxis protein histidine kinase CheA